MSAAGSFRDDGLPNSAEYATVTGNISTGHLAISTHGGNSSVNITDIVVSKNTDGDFTFFDGTTGNGSQVLKLFVKASDNGNSTDVINFTQALKIRHNAGLYVLCDSTDTDYSLLINYYHSSTR
jgi:lipopolysaccharide export LptBFGC system permease protein LptF